MRICRSTQTLLAGLATVSLGLVANAADAPSVQQMLVYKPLQKGVVYSTPAPAELPQCKVELMNGTVKGASGWVLKDPKGLLLRKYFDTNADKYPDQWSYFKDGLEVYREVDSNWNGKGFNGKVDHYVWLNGGGMKVGLDRDEDGGVDEWEAISVEELSQEVVRAVAAKDYKALEPLLVNEEDLKTLGAPAREISRIRELQKQGPGKFQQLSKRFAHLNESTRWVHLEAQPPSRLPADATGMKQDVLMYYRAMVLCETGNKTDYLQLPEIVRVGEAWKLIDAPLPGDADTVVAVPAGSAPAVGNEDPEIQTLLKRLADHDAKAPAYSHHGPNADVVKHYLARISFLEALAAKSKDAEREQWLRQIVDSLSTAVQASPGTDGQASRALAQLSDRFAREKPGSDLAAYAAFRQLSTEYSMSVASVKKAEEMLALQTKHVERLAVFVQSYPRSEDAAEGLLQLGTISEFQNKEAEARKYYEQLVRTFSQTRQGLKATGALRRLGLVGNTWEIAGPVVSLTGHQFTLNQVRGRVVIAYYYATWCQTAASDFAKLRQVLQQYSSQGVDVVAINVDEEQAAAEPFAKQNPQCWHLFAGGGLESPLATHYGLIVFPNLFLVGRDGKVISRTVDIRGLEEEVKKALK
jgi:thiol-disulfide isomerase/thioredoxin